MANISALITLLDSDPRFDSAVREGNNAAILKALNATKPGGAKVYDDLPQAQFTAALAGETLTARQEADVARFLATDGRLKLTDPNVRTWLAGLPSTAIDKIRAYAYRDPTLAEDEGITDVSKRVQMRDVRDAVGQLSKSHRAIYSARAAGEQAFTDGDPRDAPPYGDQDLDDAWQSGWDKAQIRAAYTEGFGARLDSVPRTGVPYSSPDPREAAWLRGWDRAEVKRVESEAR